MCFLYVDTHVHILIYCGFDVIVINLQNLRLLNVSDERKKIK
jgi:hypothetical protein